MSKYLWIPVDYDKDVELLEPETHPPFDRIQTWVRDRCDPDAETFAPQDATELNERATIWLTNYSDFAEHVSHESLRGDVIIAGNNFETDVPERMAEYFVHRPTHIAQQVQTLIETRRLTGQRLEATSEEIAEGKAIWETPNGDLLVGVSFVNEGYHGHFGIQTPEGRIKLKLHTQTPEGNLMEATLLYAAATQLTHPEAHIQGNDLAAAHRAIMKNFMALELDGAGQVMKRIREAQEREQERDMGMDDGLER